VAVGFYLVAIDRVKQHELAVMILTIALAMLLQEVFLIFFSGEYMGIDPFFRGYVEIIGVRVSWQHIFSILACIVALGLVWGLLTGTRIGTAIRAVSQDTEIANVMGINVSRICLISVGISAMLAGLAAVVVAPILMVHPYMWTPPLIIILAAVVLGGLGSIKGSIIGAFVLGFVEVLVVSLIPGGSYLRGVASLVAMIIVLIARPEGLFGVVFEEERL